MRKLLIALFATVLLLLAAVVLIPLLFKDRLITAATDAINDQVEAEVAFDGVGVSMISTFPNLAVTLEGLRITGQGDFAGVELARLGRLQLVMGLGSVLSSGTLEIRRLGLEDASIQMLVDAEGRSNLDAALASAEKSQPAAAEPAAAQPGDAPTTPYHLALRDIQVDNLAVLYDDQQSGLHAEVLGLSHRSRGDISTTTIRMDTHTDISSLSYSDAGVDLLKAVHLVADVDFTLDQASSAITFAESSISLNELALAFSGSVTPQGDDLALDLSLNAPNADFRSLLSLVPAIYTQDYTGLKAAGTLALTGHVKGVLPATGDDLPGFDLALKIENGSFQYPDLPSSLEAVQVDLTVKHPGGDVDLVETDVSRLHLEMAGNPIDGNLRLLHPTTDPNLSAHLKGKLDLLSLATLVPMEGVKMSGMLDADLTVAGRVSQFEKQQVDAVRAEGFFKLSDATYEDVALPMPIAIDSVEVALAPQKAELKDMRVRFGQSDLQGSGRVDNLVAWMLTDATLLGSLSLTSALLDLAPFTGDTATATGTNKPADADTNTSSLVAVPTNLNLSLSGRFQKVLYNKMELTNVNGNLRVADGKVHIDNMDLGVLGGRIGLKGTYAAATDQAADVDLQVDMGDFVIKEAAAAIETLRRIAPIAEKSEGSFGSAVHIKTRLLSDLTPDMASLFSRGSLRAKDIKVAPAFMGLVAQQVGNQRLANLGLGDKTLNYEIRDGRVFLSPVSLALADAKGTLAGSTGVIDESLDLTLDLMIPMKKIGSADLLGKLGVDHSGDIPIRVAVTGTFRDPKVRLDMGDLKDQLVDAVTAVVVEQVVATANTLIAEASKQGDALIAEAEKAKDKLVTEAKSAGKRLKDEAEAQGDKLVAEAKGKPLQELAAEEAAKALKKEAKKAATKLLEEANSKGDALINAARTKKDKLVADATAKVNGG